MWGFPHEEAAQILVEYLSWARSERSRRHFLAPKDDYLSRSAFSRLASPPPEWRYGHGSTDANIQIWQASEMPEPGAGAFWSWSLLGTDRPLVLSPLPSSTHRRLIEISIPRLQSPDDEAAHELGPRQTREIERFIPPLDIDANADKSPWLRLSAVDPRALQTCGRLAEATTEYLGEIAEDDLWRSPVVQKSKALDRIEGRSSLYFALEDILVKGYEQGFDALCHAHLHQSKRLHEWVTPIAELIGTKGKLEGVRICWIPVAPMAAQPVQEVKETRKVRSRRRPSSTRQSKSAIRTKPRKRAG
jgi:hypothetical protein